MRILKGIFLIIFVISTTAFADDTSKSAKLIEFMKISGLYQRVERQHADDQKLAKTVGSEAIKNLKSQFPNMKESTLRVMETAYQNFMESAKPAWTVQEAVEVWKKYYGSHVTEKELDEIIEFYKSPIGQKQTLSLKEAIHKTSTFIKDKHKKVFEPFHKAYIGELENLKKKEQEEAAQIERERRKKEQEKAAQIQRERIKKEQEKAVQIERERMRKELEKAVQTERERMRKELEKAVQIEKKSIEHRMKDGKQSEKGPQEKSNNVRKMGTENAVKIDGLSYWILAADWEENLPTVEYGKNAFPEAHFLVIDIKVSNTDSKPKTIPPFYLIDRQGTEYEACRLNKTILINLLVGDSSEPISYGTQRNGRVIFDVPKQDGYRLKVSGDLHGKGGDVFLEIETY